MNTLLSLSSILFVTLGSYLTLGLLRHLGDWSQRRKAQCVVLAAPLVSLAIGIGGLCLRGMAPWDSLLSVALPLTMGLIVLGALVLGIVRLALMAQIVARRGGIADPALQARVDDLAKRLSSARPRILLCLYDRPLAVTCGLWRPVILLSIWMTEHLDERELEAVLAHELEHVARHDYFITWAATGALTKVWLHALNEPAFEQFSAIQSLVEAEKTIDDRIKRLLTPHEPPAHTYHAPAVIFRMSLAVLVTFLLPGLVNAILMLILMGCGPASLPGKLF